MTGATSYRARTRDRRRCPKSRKLKYFGLVRPLDQNASANFLNIFNEIPNLSGRRIKKDRLVEPDKLGIKLINVGVVSSAVMKAKNKPIEQKDINPLPEQIKHSLNGLGSPIVKLVESELRFGVKRKSGLFIGSLGVSKYAEDYQILNKGIEHATRELHERIDSTTKRKRPNLSPRIDIFKTGDEKVANITMERFGQVMSHEGAEIVLKSVVPYFPNK